MTYPDVLNPFARIPPAPLTLSQKLYALSSDVHTEENEPGHGRSEFHQAPDGWAWGERAPRRPGLYLWRYTPKWEPWFRRVAIIRAEDTTNAKYAGQLGAWSHRHQQLVPLDLLIGKSGSSLWLLPNNQRELKPSHAL